MARCWMSLVLTGAALFAGVGAQEGATDGGAGVRTSTKQLSKDVVMRYTDDPDNSLTLTFSIGFLTGAGGSDRDAARRSKLVHGVLALIGGAVFVPMGTAAAVWRGKGPLVENRRFFFYHRLLQCAGLAFVLTAGIYALVRIYPGSGDIVNDMPLHGRFGLVVMVMLTVQPFLGVTYLGLQNDKARTIVMVLHKLTGRMATIQGLLQCAMGAFIAHRQHKDERAFDYMLGFALSSAVVFVASYIGGQLWSKAEEKKCENVKKTDSPDAMGKTNTEFASV